MSAQQESDNDCAVINRAVAARVRKLRQERGVSQAAMASCLGITLSAFHKYETCSVRIPAGALYLIAERLSVQVDELYSEVGALHSDMEHHVRAAELLGSFHAVQSEHLRRALIDVSRHLVAAQAEAARDRDAMTPSPAARTAQEGHYAGAPRRATPRTSVIGPKARQRKRVRVSSVGPVSS